MLAHDDGVHVESDSASVEHERTSGRTWYADDERTVRDWDEKGNLPHDFVKTIHRGKTRKIQDRQRADQVDISHCLQAKAKNDRAFYEQIARERIYWDGRSRVDEHR